VRMDSIHLCIRSFLMNAGSISRRGAKTFLSNSLSESIKIK
jgi:hypothetical protein